MSIKLLTGIAGANFSYAPGEIVSLDKETEQNLIKSGQAETVKSAPAKKKSKKK